MNRTSALIVSLAVGVAAIAGIFAVGHTVALGNQANAKTDRQIARRTAQLNRYEASLRRALAQKPPKLPPVPAAGSTAAPAQIAVAASAPSAPAVRVVYHRPPPIVVVKHRAGGEHESDAEGGGADD